MQGRLSGQFLWGSGFPFLTPERCLAELEGLSLPDDVLDQVLQAQRGPDPDLAGYGTSDT